MTLTEPDPRTSTPAPARVDAAAPAAPTPPQRRVVVIAYAGADQPIARALRDALNFPDADVYCDKYAAIGPLNALEDPRHRLRTEADVLLVINPRFDAERSEPAAAIRAFASAPGDRTRRRVYVALCGELDMDTSVARALRKLRKTPWLLLRPRLLNDEHHQPASLESMEAVGAALAAELRTTYRPPQPGSVTRWKGVFRKWRRTKIGIGIAAAVGIGVFVMQTLDVVGGAVGAVVGAFRDDPPPVVVPHAAKAPPAVPELRVTFPHPTRKMPIGLHPERVAPTVSDTLTIRTTPDPGRCNYIAIVQPGVEPSAHAVRGDDLEGAYKPVSLPLTEAGVYTVLAISTPLGAATEQEIVARIRDATAASPLILPDGVWFEWKGDRHEHAYPTGVKGMPSLAGQVPESDAWAIRLRQAIFAGPDAGEFALAGWSFPVAEPTAGGMP